MMDKNVKYIGEETGYILKKGILTRERIDVIRRIAAAGYPKDFNAEMSKYNETLIDIPVEDAYEEVFGQAAAEYTEKYSTTTKIKEYKTSK